MDNKARKRPDPALLYEYARRLEGTFPRDEGAWGVSACRAARFYELQDGTSLPAYQSANSVEEVAAALWRKWCPMVTFRVTDAWAAVTTETITVDIDNGDSRLLHTVELIGYDLPSRTLSFVNSWGKEWGDEGFGNVSFEYFQERAVESWVALNDCPMPEAIHTFREHDGIAVLGWCAPDVLVEPSRKPRLFVVDVYRPARNERLGWALLVRRGARLVVEDLYVVPWFRGGGVGRMLVDAVLEVAADSSLPAEFRVLHPDATDGCDDARARLAGRIGVQLTPSEVLWHRQTATWTPP